MTETTFTLELEKDNRSHPCSCCGRVTRHIKGFIYSNDDAYGVYLARWSEGHPELGASMVISIRGWGEGADPSQRLSISLEWFREPPGCRVIDGASGPWASEPFLGAPLSRARVMDTPLETEVFRISDTVFEHDPRFREYFTLTVH